MSLRTRLAVLYTSIVGGILFLFGTAVYGAVSFSLISQVDGLLQNTVEQIWPNIYVDSQGVLGVRNSPDLELAPGLLFQIWGRQEQLIYTNTPQIITPLDSIGIEYSEPVFRYSTLNSTIGSVHLRVITVPMVIGAGGRKAGSLQVASSLAVIDTTQLALLWVLVVGSVSAMGIAGIAGWMSTRQALAPLEGVTQVATQITKADDLSRRIPYQGPSDDEVGQLIQAFNQTLGRLENLFNTQRRFLADVGHELRTPLTVIRGNVDLMRRMDSIDIESMDSIENEVDRLTRLVGDLLLLAQAESGKLPLNIRLVELDTLLLDVMQQMRVLTHNRLNLKLGEIDQVLVCGDQDRLKQVFVNLIGNAIQYTPEGGDVVVSIGKVGERGRVVITDTGQGIPQEDLPHIFERFYRGSKSRTRQKDGKGYGLGLSIAYWIIRNHRGQIDVDSQPGMGTSFYVWLPLAHDDCVTSTTEAAQGDTNNK
ncbi:MAG TPA: HAMP domain-containing sensor histidine kinase [Anaerolineales bacterium]